MIPYALMFWFGSRRAPYGVAKCYFPPPELEITDSIEEHLKDTSISVVRHRRPRRSRKACRDQVPGRALICGNGSDYLAVCPATGFEFAVRNSRAQSDWPEPGRPLWIGEPEICRVHGGSAQPSGIFVFGGSRRSRERRRTAAGHGARSVVAREFQGFDFQRAHLVQVSEKQSMHVAYRMGDKVYWTRKKVALHPGETLISDGKIVARTRCGNRIAMAPLGPPAIVEPVEADFNEPLFSNDMVTREAEPQLEPTRRPCRNRPIHCKPAKRRRILPFFLLPFFGLPGGAAVRPTLHWRLLLSPAPCCCFPRGWWECTGRPGSRGANHKCELSGRSCRVFPIQVS